MMSGDLTREPQIAPPSRRSKRWLLLGIYLALAAGTFGVFSGVVNHEFVGYDDDDMIFMNPHVKHGLTLDGFKFAWTGPHVGNWHPLTTLSLMLDCQVFGIKHPGLHHLESLCLHIGEVLLLFEALRRMTGELWPSALVAALFAIHPLRVESVAWAAERKDVLSGLFWMLTLVAYAWYARRPGIGRYGAVCVSFGLGLLSKPMLVTLPCALLLLDYWPLRRLRGPRFAAAPAQGEAEAGAAAFSPSTLAGLLLEKIPLFVAAAVVSGIEARSQIITGSAASLSGISIPWRLVNAAVAYVMYLWKTIWPTGLAVLYPHPGVLPGADISHWLWPAFGAALLLLAISGYVILRAVRRPYLAVGWLWYLGTMLPVIGLMQVGLQAYADRFTYIPLIGIYVAVAWSARDLVRRWPATRYAVSLVALGSLAALSVASWIQVGYWFDSRTLFAHALTVNDDNYVMQNNLGHALVASHRPAEGIPHFERALQLNRNYDAAENNLGNALEYLGRVPESLPHFYRALQLNEKYAPAYYNLGYAMMAMGKFPEAVEYYEQGLKLQDDADAQDNLGNALMALGKVQQAVPHYRHALELQEDFPEAHFNLGNALWRMGKPAEAVDQFERALQLKSDYADAQINLGRALASLGRFQEAIERYQRALEQHPDLPEVHNNLAILLVGAGRTAEGIQHYKRALQLKSDYPEAEINLAYALAITGKTREAIEHYERGLQRMGDSAPTQNTLALLLAVCPPAEGGNPVKAVAAATRACELTGYRNAEYLYTLATAYAAAHRFPDAIATAQKAIPLARSRGLAPLADEIEAHLTLYKSGRR